MIENIVLASIWIPKLVKSAKRYAEGNQTLRNELIELYEPSVVFYNSLLFYSDLFINDGTYVDFDAFNYVPLTYDEITMLILHARSFTTVVSDKLTVNGLSVKYTS